MSYDYTTEKAATKIVGDFADIKNADFKHCLENISEDFRVNSNYDIWDPANFYNTLKNEGLREEYKQQLLGDVFESANMGETEFEKEWYQLNAAKLEQLFENTSDQIVAESYGGAMNPIIAYTLPILKKNYYECISKEIMQTQVPNQPIVRMGFERSFLRDKAGNKHYIPDVFYDDTYKEIMKEANGIDLGEVINAKVAASTINLALPLNNFSVLQAAGGSMEKRNRVDWDFCISAVKYNRPQAEYRVPLKLNPTFDESQPENKTSNPKYVADTASPLYIAGKSDKATLTDVDGVIYPVNIEPNYANQGSLLEKLYLPGFQQTSPHRVPTDASGTEYDGAIYSLPIRPEKTEVTIYGDFRAYDGVVNVMASNMSIVKEVRFGGHLSNEMNERVVDVDYERKPFEWKIPERERLNCGVTIEKIMDTKALQDIDLTNKFIADMTTSLTHFEDSNTLDYVDNSFEKWKVKTDLPFGYDKHVFKGTFIEEMQFSCTPPQGVTKLQPEWIDQMLKFNIDRLLEQLNTKLNQKNLMYVIYGHPLNITLLKNHVKWVASSDTKVGGVQLEYKFGVLNDAQTRVVIVSSQKVRPDSGIRILAYPTSNDVITFRHFKYSFNIENQYRNGLTPLTPNIMATHRYTTVELFPIQARVHLTNNGFGNLNPVGVQTSAPGYYV